MWEYKREEREFEEIPEGTYRCRILSAEKAVSKASGNDMLVLRLEISGFAQNLWNYIVFLNEKPEITNRMLTQMFDSFEIEEGNFNLASYVGKAGACKVKHDEDGRAKVHYFIRKKQQENLPPFVSKTGGVPVAGEDGYMKTPDGKDDFIPF